MIIRKVYGETDTKGIMIRYDNSMNWISTIRSLSNLIIIK